jgi:hypothetical protein
MLGIYGAARPEVPIYQACSGISGPEGHYSSVFGCNFAKDADEKVALKIYKVSYLNKLETRPNPLILRWLRHTITPLRNCP